MMRSLLYKPLSRDIPSLSCALFRNGTTSRKTSLYPPRSVPGAVQRRCITQRYLARMAEAEAQWEGWANEIREGKRHSFLSFMEERGLIHSVIGG